MIQDIHVFKLVASAEQLSFNTSILCLSPENVIFSPLNCVAISLHKFRCLWKSGESISIVSSWLLYAYHKYAY